MKITILAILGCTFLTAFWFTATQAREPIHMPEDALTGKPMNYKPREEPKTPKAPPKPDKNAKSPEFLRAQQQCNPSLSRPANPMYRDLKGITLFVHVPGIYTAAEKCVGHEEQCADKVHFYSAQERIDYLNDLKKHGALYSEPLRRENLIRLFGDMLRKELTPYVLPDNECKVPDIVIADKSNDVRAAQQTADMLTVGLTLNIIDTTKTPIAVLTLGTYRPDPEQKHLWFPTLTGHSTAIPLDLADDEISDLIGKFIRYFEVTDEKGVEH